MRRFLYRCLVGLHPATFRRQFAGEMLWIFDEAAGSAGAGAFFADGLISLARQWLLRSGAWTMAAGGLGAFVMIGGMLGLGALPLRHVRGPVFTEPDVPAWPASRTPGEFDGHWSGYFVFPGPAGQMEFTLSRSNGLWSGDLQMHGLDGVVHRGVAEDIRVGADSLSFSFKTNRGDMIYRGRLIRGKLRGFLRPAAAAF